MTVVFAVADVVDVENDNNIFYCLCTRENRRINIIGFITVVNSRDFSSPWDVVVCRHLILFWCSKTALFDVLCYL